MIIYLSKLILILVFNTYVNIYYINSECNCCCCKPNKNNSGGGKQVDKFEINLDNGTLKHNEDILPGFEKIDDLVINNVERVINGNFKNEQNIYYTIDEDIFNSIKEDSNVEVIKNPDSDKYIVFAVKTQAKDFKKENQKYDYYLVYCHNGDSLSGCGLFEDIVTNVEIKILGSDNNLTKMNKMFYCCENLKKIVFNPTCFNTNNVTNMSFMFSGCSSLKELNLSNFNTNNVTNMSGMFNRCTSLTTLNLISFNTSKVSDMSWMFKNCKLLPSLNISNFNTSNVTDMSNMFEECSSLKELHLSNFNTNNVKNMQAMFYKCNSLTSLNLSNFKTNYVENMENMFAGCTNLTNLTLPPDKVIHDGVTKSYENMFAVCDKLKEGKVTTKDEIILNMFKS